MQKTIKQNNIVTIARNLIIMIVIMMILFRIAMKFNLVIPFLIVIFLFFGAQIVWKRNWEGLKFYLLSWFLIVVLNYWLKLPFIITPFIMLIIFMWYKKILMHIVKHPVGAIESFCLQIEKKIYQETMDMTTAIMKRQGSTDKEIEIHFTKNKYKLQIYKDTKRINELKLKGVDFNVFGDDKTMHGEN